VCAMLLLLPPRRILGEYGCGKALGVPYGHNIMHAAQHHGCVLLPARNACVSSTPWHAPTHARARAPLCLAQLDTLVIQAPWGT
jgi:hypothetical protein